ncbi:thioesterase domain-containing protein [Rhodanobacter sp. K2T2]|uniref:thioesterase domain-containing protein n=1 Tax=Rhodanobacter sp. K2T2 TaxID=2723085 RepID=UPI0015CC0ED1|nr:alpha/beta fold hydrolase [Rhodanobacter sp. K2T2]NYE28913.1 thioesterase domain-containing protein [Rhodanobacter sp. K2T2]
MSTSGQDAKVTARTPATSIDALIPLHSTHSRAVPVICIPGAGASVTSFMPFASAIGHQRPTFGLQPLGIGPGETPCESVEDAASYHLDAICRIASRPFHLVGHSHGGRVAFELAVRLQAEGINPASLTLIDSEAPDPVGTENLSLDEAAIRGEFVHVFEKIHAIELPLSPGIHASTDRETFLSALHGLLVAHGRLPARSASSLLLGPLATFAAARRARYRPTRVFEGILRLVQVRDVDLTLDDDLAQRNAYVEEWAKHARDTDVWHGPGDHFSILQQPQIKTMACWWHDGLKS